MGTRFHLEVCSKQRPLFVQQVGILRRGRFVKGKQVGKGPVAEVGDTIKSGQVRLCTVHMNTLSCDLSSSCR